MTTTTLRTYIRTATLAALVTVAIAALPALGRAQMLEGCYAPRTGTVYRINAAGAPTQCSKGHTQFSWSVEGPKGDKGDKGDQGNTGPQGPAGGLAGVEFVQGTAKSLPSNSKESISVICPAGKSAISGGYAVSGDFTLLDVAYSAPVTSQAGPLGWVVGLVNTTGTGHIAYAWAICATRSN